MDCGRFGRHDVLNRLDEQIARPTDIYLKLCSCVWMKDVGLQSHGGNIPLARMTRERFDIQPYH